MKVVKMNLSRNVEKVNPIKEDVSKAKELIHSGLLSSEILLNRIEMYRGQLEKSDSVTEEEYELMQLALFGVQLIISDLLIDNDSKNTKK